MNLKKTGYIFAILAIFFIQNIYAQKKNTNLQLNDTVQSIPEGYVDMLDYNLSQWAAEKSKFQKNCKKNLGSPVFADSVYKSRLAKLPYIMEMPYNGIVRNLIDLYTFRKRTQMEYMLGLSKYYFPIFEQILSAAGVPMELKYLPVIESALNPTIVSSAGAAGLWQFMVSTGRAYGLEINSLVDERLDPIKSTKAAAQYLKDLYGFYGDWNLVIAAYNCGPGNVRKAMSRSGGKKDYWEIYPFLPRETRGYVPTFIAANYAFEYYKEHNLCPLEMQLPPLTDTVMLSQRVHLQQIASVINIPKNELEAINPQYKQDIIPGNVENPYPLCLPLKFIDPFINNYDSILNFHADEFNLRRDSVSVSNYIPPVYNKPSARYHVVKRGQSLGVIASRYGISVNALKRANGLHDAKIHPGQRLKIPR